MTWPRSKLILVDECDFELGCKRGRQAVSDKI